MDEITEEIQSKFSESWIATTQFYNELIDNNPELERFIPLYIFIQHLKKSGKDKIFRSSIDKQDLVIFRSLEPLLKANQKNIRIKALDGSFVVTFREGNKMLKEHTVKDLDDERVKELFQMLRDIPVS